MSDLERLAELQELDSAIDHVAYRRAHLDERIAWNESAKRLAEVTTALAANSARRADAETRYVALEQHGRDLDAKRQRLEQQMKSIVVTREAEAMQREIDLLKGERNDGDEAGLVLLDEAEVLATESEALARAVEEVELLRAGQKEALAVADAALDAELADLVARRDSAVAAIPAPLLSRYTSMRTSFKGVAVARLHGSRCSGCHLDLSRVELEAVRAVPDGEVPECPQCARILVH
jgi:hypothetical protein